MYLKSNFTALTLSTFLILGTAYPVSAGGHISGASAELIGNDGTVIGSATVTKTPHGVHVYVKVSGLTPGAHGLHLHSHGLCDTGDGFKSAKGHVGKVEGAHGMMNADGPEPGDLPNIFVAADGTGEMEAFTDLVTVDGGAHSLLDEDGSAFVIHQGPDDHITQPIGGAGARVACGVIAAQ